MKEITDIEIVPISLPDPPLLNASGLHAPVCTRIVTVLHDAHGNRGLSETPSSPATLAALEECAPLLRGGNPLNRHDLWARVDQALSRYREERGNQTWDDAVRPHVRSAIEVAALDLAGHQLDCRVADLLGGAHRPRVEAAGYLFFKYAGSGERTVTDDPWFVARDREALDGPGILAQARAMEARYGFRSFKVKGGILDPEVEVAACEHLAQHLGTSVPLRFDPNGVWSLDTALSFADRLRNCLEYLEDPVRGQESMAAFRKATGILLATNMCTTRLSDLPASQQLHSEDIILCDHHFWGGMEPCMALSHIIPSLHRTLSFHSNSHGGISLAAATHLGCAMPHLHHPIDIHYPWQDGDDIITHGSFPLTDGHLDLPDGPGLGITLDPDRLAAAQQRYADHGALQRDDESEMQKVHPDWSFQAVRY